MTELNFRLLAKTKTATWNGVRGTLYQSQSGFGVRVIAHHWLESGDVTVSVVRGDGRQLLATDQFEELYCNHVGAATQEQLDAALLAAFGIALGRISTLQSKGGR